jgi:hypothetical protein
VYYSAIGTGGEIEAWKTTTLLPARYYDHVVVKVGSFVYLLTGAAGEDDVYYAPFLPDGSLGSWTGTASLSPSRQNFAAVSHGNFIYATGGNSSGNQDFVQYTSVRADGRLNAWAFTTPLPNRIQAHTMIAHRGYLYVFGGADANNQRVNTVYYAEIRPGGALGEWMTTTPLPNKAAGYSTFESNGDVYLLGGNLGAVFTSRIREDHTLGEWTKATSLPAANLHGLRTGAYNGIAYAVGGFTLTTFRDTVFLGAIGSGTVTPTPTFSPPISTSIFTPTAPPPTHTPSGSTCSLTVGQNVQVGAGANLWSQPDVLTGTLLGPLAEGSTVFILAGPVWGRILASGEAGWWWEVTSTAGGSSAGWLWEVRIVGCS